MDMFFKGDITLKKVLLFICMGLVGLLVLNIIMKLLPLAILGFIFLAPAIFVMADAQERKIERPILWALFTLFTWVFGLLVYLLSRPEHKGKSFCAHCGGEVDASFHNCPWCGKSVQVQANCKNCSTELKPGWKFCPSCRVAVETPAPVPPSSPAVSM